MEDAHTYNSKLRLLYWVNTAKRGLVRIDSVNKLYNLESDIERNRSIDEIDYLARIKSGWYDKGVAIRCGWGIGHEHFAIGIDLDGWDAVKAWFGGDIDEEIWERVLQYAKNYLVEWHQDKNSLHLVIYLKEEIENVKIPLPGHSKNGRRQIEIQGQGLLLCASPSMHADGHQLTAIDSDVIPIIDQIQLLGLKAKIHNLYRENTFKDHLNEHENQSIFEWLHDPNTIFHEGQGRHNWTVWIVNSYYWKWSVEWLDLSDEQRFERAWQWHLTHCIPARSREEFDRICRDVINRSREKRDKEHECRRDERNKRKDQNRKRYSPEVEKSLEGKIVAQISQVPLKLIIGDPMSKTICYASIHEKEVGEPGRKSISYEVAYGRTTLNACFVDLSIHQNPLTFLNRPDKYSITFDSHQRGMFTLEGSIDTILSQLDAKGLVMYQLGAKEAITWMINEFINIGKARIDKSVDFEGYLYYDGDLHISRIDFVKKHPQRTKAECLRYINCLEKRSIFSTWKYSNRDIDRRDWLASSIKWTITAPFNFAIKQTSGKWQRWFSFSGNKDAGKSETSNEMLEIHDNFSGSGVMSTYSLAAGQFDTCSKLGRALAKTTYPISVSEFGKVEERGRNGDYMEDMKNAIEKLISRNGKDGTDYDVPFPSCSSVIINGNPPLSKKDTVIKRFDNVKLSKEDAHDRNDIRTKEFNEFRNANRGVSKILGDWTMNYIWDNRQDLILSGKYDTREIADIVIRKFYEFAGVEFPSWLGKWIVDLSLEELDVDEYDVVRSILYEHVHKSLQQGRSAGILYTDEAGFGESLNKHGLRERIKACLDRDLWSFVRKGYSSSYWVDNSILELFRVRMPELSLRRLGEIMNVEYRHTEKGWRLRCNDYQIIDFIEGKVNAEDEKEKNET